MLVESAKFNYRTSSKLWWTDNYRANKYIHTNLIIIQIYIYKHLYCFIAETPNEKEGIEKVVGLTRKSQASGKVMRNRWIKDFDEIFSLP